VISAGVGALIAICIILFELRIRQGDIEDSYWRCRKVRSWIIGAYLIGSLISRQESMACSARSKDVSQRWR